ncbi:NusB antitermination factor [Flavobacteriaceae bacterium MAR_2010_188]|nr:NusB antitermination factor [Flavobacteriaceae bacterium MAR_2010_188]
MQLERRKSLSRPNIISSLTMLNRRHIRIKVMQTLYAFNTTEDSDLVVLEKFLKKSLEDMYDLHLCMLSLLIELHKKAEKHLQKSQKKFLATAEDKAPNTKFIDNAILQFLRNNKNIKDELEKRKKQFWYLDFEYVDIVFKAIQKSEIYKSYMESGKSDFKEDKNFLINLYSEVIATNDKLYAHFEDEKLTWLDDLPVINTTVLKLIKKFKPNSRESIFLPDLYKDLDDRDYAFQLLRKTVLNQESFNKEIAERTTNWDSDRIAKMDKVLLQMALCEFQNFSSIPFKVSINEYLEIAKEYSTPKSSNFVNGILDKIVREYQKSGEFTKSGRGLL